WVSRNLPAISWPPTRKILKFQHREFGIEIAFAPSPGGFSHGDGRSNSVQRDGAGQRPGAHPGAWRGPAVHGGPVLAADHAVASGPPGHVGCGGASARPSGRLSRRYERAVRAGAGPPARNRLLARLIVLTR